MGSLFGTIFQTTAVLAALGGGLALVRWRWNFRVSQAIPWVLGFGLVVLICGAAVQVITDNMIDGWGKILHQVGAALILSGFVGLVLADRFEEQRLDSAMLPNATLRIGSHYHPSDMQRDVEAPPLQQIRRGVFEEGELTVGWIDRFAQMPNLRELDLRRAAFDETVLDQLERLPGLEVVYVRSDRLPLPQARMLQVSLPACRVLMENGIAVDRLTANGQLHPAA